MDDPFFDKIEQDSIGYDASFEIDGHTVMMGLDDLGAELERGRILAAWLRDNISTVVAKVAADVVDDVYDHVIERPSVDQLAGQLRLGCAGFTADVGAECFFDCDGDYFGGHSVCVWVDEDGTVGDGHLAG